MSYCIVIPNYNHTHLLDELLFNLVQFNLPILMVNDGSNEDALQFFESLAAKYASLTLLTHTDNLGKGAAVKTGLKAALSYGFSHALQIDADGQHDLNDVDNLLKASKANPNALISGKPVYDESVPKLRYYARNITHFWVWIETLSLQIKDTMCGFRVYPLAQTISVFNHHSLGDRMDFDIEVMVKMYWQDVEICFLPTAVNYPVDGVSHFRNLEDNLLITWMHTRLFFGMVVRLPRLIIKSFRKKIHE